MFDFQEQDYKVEARKLHLTSLPTSPFDLEIVTEIEPQNNTSLEGLYKSTGNFCTQCEAEGFRKITYFQAGCPLKSDCQLWIFSAGFCWIFSIVNHQNLWRVEITCWYLLSFFWIEAGSSWCDVKIHDPHWGLKKPLPCALVQWQSSWPGWPTCKFNMNTTLLFLACRNCEWLFLTS